MANINFLHDPKSENNEKKSDKNSENIVWSKPAMDSSASGQDKTKKEKTKKRGWAFWGFSKNKKTFKSDIQPVISSAAKVEKESVPTSVENNKISDDRDKTSSWENPEILETNLIKDEIIFFFDWQKNIILLCLLSFLSIAIIGVAYFWLDSWGQKIEAENAVFVSAFARLQNETKNIELEMADIVTFKKRLALAKTLLDNHIYWTNFFDFLENNTLEEVYYTGGFKGGRSGQYSMSAKTTGFNVVAEQIKALRKNENILNVDVSSGELKEADKDSGEEVDFTLNFSINPSIFIK